MRVLGFLFVLLLVVFAIGLWQDWFSVRTSEAADSSTLVIDQGEIGRDAEALSKKAADLLDGDEDGDGAEDPVEHAGEPRTVAGEPRTVAGEPRTVAGELRTIEGTVREVDLDEDRLVIETDGGDSVALEAGAELALQGIAASDRVRVEYRSYDGLEVATSVRKLDEK